MNYQMATMEALKIEKFLTGRDWKIDGDLTREIERASVEIERIQQSAIRAIVGKLERYAQEAQLWAGNEMTDLNGDPEPISKREQQKSATDEKHIRAAIAKIGGTG